MVFVGMVSYGYLENWTAANAFYFSIQTMTTVGYGDEQIEEDSTRTFTMFFVWACVLIFSASMDNIRSARESQKLEKKKRRLLRNIKESKFESIKKFVDYSEDECQFVLACLCGLKKVHDSDIAPIREVI